ncbi:PREDICTED: snurportin-1 [Drosophila arizonae]|uniref:Snurportin-1 n=1 Tax=Drosophila arizonae TaxID=7263 RepID=A0ABM1P286_DROAR|nr:PREDICTED: snurportin-1 [Drosophila arizonae]
MSSNYKELYKKSVDLGEQQKLRQQQLLYEQKRRRQLQQDVHRLVKDSDDDDDDEQEQSTSSGQSKAQQKKRRQRNKNTKNNNNDSKNPYLRLQQSEWLRHRPDNLSDWLLLPCPVGKRCLVMASNGRTKVYNKAGRIVMQLRSLLPGDGYVQKFKTVLDCVYVQEMDTFFVLDALSFGQQLLLDCDANFRFFWLRSRFDEHGELSERSNRNEKPLKLLEYYDFEDASAVEQALQRYPQWEANQPQLDGLLFYHKEASYTCGSTPLVCWLFPFMLPDVLNLPVHSGYEAPDDYLPSAALEYMDEFDRKLLAQRQQLKKSSKAIETVKEPAAVAADVNAMDEDDDLEEFAELRSLLDHQRRLELGELDMDCSPAMTAPEPEPEPVVKPGPAPQPVAKPEPAASSSSC